MSEFEVLRTAAGGMDAQRAALDLAARNVAAAEAGGAFTRLVPRFYIPPSPAPGDAVDAAFAAVPDDATIGDEGAASDGVVRLAGVAAQPGIEVDAVTEMVAVLNAQRAYEANASVFEAGKRLAERTIDLGRP
jgi:flagellar basal-body rod protein FlgC